MKQLLNPFGSLILPVTIKRLLRYIIYFYDGRIRAHSDKMQKIFGMGQFVPQRQRLFISAVFQMVQRNVVGTPREGASSNEQGIEPWNRQSLASQKLGHLHHHGPVECVGCHRQRCCEGREPWSSGYGRRLMHGFESQHRILDGTFFHTYLL